MDNNEKKDNSGKTQKPSFQKPGTTTMITDDGKELVWTETFGWIPTVMELRKSSPAEKSWPKSGDY